MITSALTSHLTDVMNVFDDALIVVPSYVESRDKAAERVEVTKMVLCGIGESAAQVSRFRAWDPSEPVTASIVLKGSR
jgi:hypothetical protein